METEYADNSLACTPLNALPEGAVWLRAVEAALQAGGFRTSHVRQTLLTIIAEVEGPFRTEELVAGATAHGDASRPSVYRLVGWLRETGWIGRIHHTRAERLYVRQFPGMQQHLVCTECGTATLITGGRVHEFMAALLAETGFAVRSHVLELYGVCGLCRGTEAV